jgi:hypothetical protein
MFGDDLFTEKFNNGFSLVLGVIVGLSTLFTVLLVTLPKQYDPYIQTSRSGSSTRRGTRSRRWMRMGKSR